LSREGAGPIGARVREKKKKKGGKDVKDIRILIQ
jgi:hypothetical protein